MLTAASATVSQQHVARFDAELAQPFDDAALLQAVDRVLDAPPAVAPTTAAATAPS